MKLWLFSLGVVSKEFENDVFFFNDTEKKSVCERQYCIKY